MSFVCRVLDMVLAMGVGVLGMGPYPDATKIGQTIKKTTMFAHTIFSILANWLQR
jgi:hypothetical protein